PPLRLPVDGLGEHWDIRRVVGVGRSLPWWQRLSAVLIRLGRARRDGIEVESVGERPYDLTCLSDNTGFAAEPLGSLEAARFGLPTRVDLRREESGGERVVGPRSPVEAVACFRLAEVIVVGHHRECGSVESVPDCRRACSERTVEVIARYLDTSPNFWVGRVRFPSFLIPSGIDRTNPLE